MNKIKYIVAVLIAIAGMGLQQALQLAIPQDNSALIWDLQLNIADYQKNRPLRDPGALNKTPAVESGNHN